MRQAERNLAAATARIGQATADFYPTFRLVGTIGLESLRAADLWEWASRFWTIGPALQWRLFDAGKIRWTIEIRTAQHEQAFVRYESALLKALEEVKNALVAFAKEQRRLEQMEKAVAAAQRAAFRARDRYQAGLVDFTDVLDAQRTLQNFQDERAQSRGAVTAHLVRLYKALGGGWQPSPVENP
ncbi:TolC family protein [Desulfosoma sp.]|uniref:TolC family protein n=1 Tax=Desulfosoma sp. TaxID=2603217 RepID=UPI00404A0D03